MPADPLTDVLLLTNARATASGTLVAGGAWALHFPPPRRLKVVAVVRGACWLTVDGEGPPARLDAGDAVMLPADRAFGLAGDLRTLRARPDDGARVFAGAIDHVARVGEGDGFLAVGAHIALDPARGPLLTDVLPPVVRVGGRSPEAEAMRWLLEHLAHEVSTDRPGAVLASAQLAQLVFLQLLRAHLASGAPLPPGWAGALRDERLAPALRLLHADPGRAWRLDELARAANMSRTGFAVRFRAAAGVAPLTYLARWRMHLAERELREGARPVGEVARALGYTSESAFSHAFTRATGVAPRRYRAEAAAGAPQAGMSM